ncbi:MAG: DUF2157 domain-containing protein [Nitriliruptor sp.]
MSVGIEGPLDDRIAEWQRAGLLTADQAAAIAAHERARPGVDPPPDPDRRGRRDRTTAAEAIGYVGAALVLGAVGLFLGELWEELTTWGQLALAALVTVLMAGASWPLRRSTAPAMQRLVSVLHLGVVTGTAWCAFIVAEGPLGWREEDLALTVGVVAALTAVPLYLTRRRALPQLVLLVALLTLLGAIVARPDLGSEPFWYALPFAALGAVWLLLGEGGYLPPRPVAVTSGAVLALVALQCAAFGDLRVLALVLAIAAAAALVVAAVAGGGLHHLAVGAVGLFVLVPQLVFELFGDAIGAPATLLLVGMLLVLLAVGLGRARREVVTQGGAS